MNIFYRIDCKQIIKLAEELSFLGTDVADLFKRAFDSIESLGTANRWRGNNYNAELKEINNFYLEKINNIIDKITAEIPGAIVNAVNNYSKANGGEVYPSNINHVPEIPELQIIEGDKIVFYESDIKEAIQKFSNYLNNTLISLQEYKRKFNLCGIQMWQGFAMDEYDRSINDSISKSEEMVSDINKITTYNLNKAQEKLSIAEKKNLISITSDGGMITEEYKVNATDGINTEFYDKFISGKTNGSLSSIAKITKGKFVNTNKKIDMYDKDTVHVISDMYKDGDKTTADCSSYVGFVLYNYYVANKMEDKLEILKTYRGKANGKRKQ